MKEEASGKIKLAREELLSYSEKPSYFAFEKTQHALSFNYCMLLNGLAILLLTSCTAIMRMNLPTRHAAVASPLISLVNDAGGAPVFVGEDGTIRTKVGFQSASSIASIWDWIEGSLDAMLYAGDDSGEYRWR